MWYSQLNPVEKYGKVQYHTLYQLYSCFISNAYSMYTLIRNTFSTLSSDKQQTRAEF